MVHPAVPHIAGRALIIDRGRLLLVRGDGDGSFWTLPGGRAGLGEDVKSCVRREVFEETGLHVSVGELFAVSEYFDRTDGFHIMQTMFYCTVDDGVLQDSWVDRGGPVVEACFFTLDEMAALPKIFPAFLLDGAWQDGTAYVRYQGMETKDLGN